MSSSFELAIDCFMQEPINVQIQTASRCNGKCIICPYLDSWHKANPGIMSDEVFERMLDELAPMQIGKLCMYLENEPLLDPDLLERTMLARNKLAPESLELSTNASALTLRQTLFLAQCVENIPHEIWISFHGVNKRTHEGCMGLDYDSCLANIICLLNISDEKKLDIIIRGGGMPMGNVPKHEFTFTQKEFHDFWNRVFQESGIRRKAKLNYFRYHDRAGTIRRNDIRNPDIVRRDLRGMQCSRLTNWLHFLYTGELIICCMDYHREEIIGDVTRCSLREILEGPTFNNLLDRAEGRAPSDDDFICKRCISPGG